MFWVASRLGIGLRTPAAALQIPVTYGRFVKLDGRFLGACRRAGKLMHIWTVNDADEMNLLLDMGVDGIMSDRPDVLKTVFEERDLSLA
jgi:glycerophosphoryl diester phosphodiesterase